MCREGEWPRAQQPLPQKHLEAAGFAEVDARLADGVVDVLPDTVATREWTITPGRQSVTLPPDYDH